MALIIGGETQFNGSTSLVTKGYPLNSGVMSLFIGPQNFNDSLDTFIQGPPFIASTLFITTQENPASGDLGSLYILGQTGFGGADYQGNIPLTLFRGFGGDKVNEDWNLFIQGPTFEEDTEEETLFIAGPTPDQDDDGKQIFVWPRRFRRSTLKLVASGAIPSSSNPEQAATNTNLFIRNAVSTNTSTDLFIEKDYNQTGLTDLNIRGAGVETGTITMFVDGQFLDNESTDLFIKGPTLETTTIYTVGWQPN